MCVCVREREREREKEREREREREREGGRERMGRGQKASVVYVLVFYAIGLLTRASASVAVRLGWFLRSRSLFDTKSILARVRSKCAGIRKHISDSDCVVKITVR